MNQLDFFVVGMWLLWLATTFLCRWYVSGRRTNHKLSQVGTVLLGIAMAMAGAMVITITYAVYGQSVPSLLFAVTAVAFYWIVVTGDRPLRSKQPE